MLSRSAFAAERPDRIETWFLTVTKDRVIWQHEDGILELVAASAWGATRA